MPFETPPRQRPTHSKGSSVLTLSGTWCAQSVSREGVKGPDPDLLKLDLRLASIVASALCNLCSVIQDVSLRMWTVCKCVQELLYGRCFCSCCLPVHCYSRWICVSVPKILFPARKICLILIFLFFFFLCTWSKKPAWTQRRRNHSSNTKTSYWATNAHDWRISDCSDQVTFPSLCCNCSLIFVLWNY